MNGLKSRTEWKKDMEKADKYAHLDAAPSHRNAQAAEFLKLGGSSRGQIALHVSRFYCFFLQATVSSHRLRWMASEGSLV